MSKFIKQIKDNEFHKILNISIISSIIIAIIGILMYCIPEITDRIIGIILGICFILKAISILIKYLKKEGARLYKYDIIYSILLIVLALLIMLVPFKVSAFLTVCFGLYLIIIGANRLTYGVWFKIADESAWLITITMGILNIIIGILSIINPFDTFLAMTKVIGIFLIISSILDITSTIMIKKRVNRIIQMFW